MHSENAVDLWLLWDIKSTEEFNEINHWLLSKGIVFKNGQQQESKDWKYNPATCIIFFKSSRLRIEFKLRFGI